MKKANIQVDAMSVMEFKYSVITNLCNAIKSEQIDSEDIISEGFPKFDMERLNDFVKNVKDAYPLDELIPNCLILLRNHGTCHGAWIVMEGHAEFVLEHNFKKLGISIDSD